jgi:hypothetical protein
MRTMTVPAAVSFVSRPAPCSSGFHAACPNCEICADTAGCVRCSCTAAPETLPTRHGPQRFG